MEKQRKPRGKREPGADPGNIKRQEDRKMTMLAGKGHWVGTEDRQPVKYGRYRVVCIQRGARTEADYLWNGAYWVTPKGSPSKGVRSWWEQAEETLPKSSQPAAARALTLADYEARIHLYKEQIGTGYIGIGRTLIEAKEAKVVPHGQWESWVTETTGLTPRQAQRCMQAATEIRDGSAMARLEMSKALLLLGSGLDEEAREEIAEKAADEGATVKALREEIRQTKLKLVQETGTAAEIREALKKAEEEREQLKVQIPALAKAYNDRLEVVREDAYKRGEMAGGADAAAEIRRLRNDLEQNRQQRQSLQDRLAGEREKADQRIREMEKQAENSRKMAENAVGRLERAKDLAREELEREFEAKMESTNKQNVMLYYRAQEARKEAEEEVAEELKALRRDREDMLAAAEEAEKRAADAEAELEALRAGGGQDRTPAADKVNSAVFQFLSVCGYMTDRPEVLQRVDAQSARNILCGVDILQGWCEEVYKILEGTVEAEGAVE